MAADSLWQLDAVSLGATRLREITVSISRGVTAVIGWSGAGKTSLLNLLTGFEKPDAGKVHGTPQVAWVPQSGGLWLHCSAREHLEIAGGTTTQIDELLEAFDLQKRSAARPAQLSQGEQSRLAVARALVTPAEILVMDEPLVHVDPARASGYWEVIRRHLSTAGTSLVFSSHVPETVLGEAEHVICLREGRMLHVGSAIDLYRHPPSAELMGFLGPGNWLTPTQARQWLQLEIPEPRCFRPEEVLIQSAGTGPLVIESVRFMGTVGEGRLRNSLTGETQVFLHRPATTPLRPGETVTLCRA